MELGLRPIEPADNLAVAHVIRTVMPEFGCVGTGFSINDPEVDDMYATYIVPGSGFFVLYTDDLLAGAAAGAMGSGEESVVGVGGYAPLAGGDPGVCELRKMYLLPGARGHGGGRWLLEHCLNAATAAGYDRMYLETVAAMTAAAAVYRKFGFVEIPEPLGATGHSGCDRFMVRPLG